MAVGDFFCQDVAFYFDPADPVVQKSSQAKKNEKFSTWEETRWLIEQAQGRIVDHLTAATHVVALSQDQPCCQQGQALGKVIRSWWWLCNCLRDKQLLDRRSQFDEPVLVTCAPGANGVVALVSGIKKLRRQVVICMMHAAGCTCLESASTKEITHLIVADSQEAKKQPTKKMEAVEKAGGSIVDLMWLLEYLKDEGFVDPGGSVSGPLTHMAHTDTDISLSRSVPTRSNYVSRDHSLSIKHNRDAPDKDTALSPAKLPQHTLSMLGRRGAPGLPRPPSDPQAPCAPADRHAAAHGPHQGARGASHILAVAPDASTTASMDRQEMEGAPAITSSALERPRLTRTIVGRRSVNGHLQPTADSVMMPRPAGDDSLVITRPAIGHARPSSSAATLARAGVPTSSHAGAMVPADAVQGPVGVSDEAEALPARVVAPASVALPETEVAVHSGHARQVAGSAGGVKVLAEQRGAGGSATEHEIEGANMEVARLVDQFLVPDESMEPADTTPQLSGQHTPVPDGEQLTPTEQDWDQHANPSTERCPEGMVGADEDDAAACSKGDTALPDARPDNEEAGKPRKLRQGGMRSVVDSGGDPLVAAADAAARGQPDASVEQEEYGRVVAAQARPARSRSKAKAAAPSHTSTRKRSRSAQPAGPSSAAVQGPRSKRACPPTTATTPSLDPPHSITPSPESNDGSRDPGPSQQTAGASGRQLRRATPETGLPSSHRRPQRRNSLVELLERDGPGRAEGVKPSGKRAKSGRKVAAAEAGPSRPRKKSGKSAAGVSAGPKTALVEPRPGRSPSRTRPFFALSRLHSEEQKKYLAILKQLGYQGIAGNDSHGWDSRVTHVVCPALARCTKTLAAMAVGCWIVSTAYLDASAAAKRLLDPAPYELSTSPSKLIDVGAPAWWRQRGSGGGRPFQALKVFISSLADSDDLKRWQLKQILEAGGAAVTTTKRDADLALVPSTKSPAATEVKQLVRCGVSCVDPMMVVDWLAWPKASLKKHYLFGTERFAEKVQLVEQLRGSVDGEAAMEETEVSVSF